MSPVQRAMVVAVACNVPDCQCADQFLQPCDLQKTGWLEVCRLGDSSTRVRQFICPKHAAKLGLRPEEWADSPSFEQVERGFNAIGNLPFPGQVFPEVTPRLKNLLTRGQPTNKPAELEAGDDE
jgi:hypothetical protein